MSMMAAVLVAIVALLHLGFLVLEMFYWDHPVGRRIFRTDVQFSARSATLAANQGLYNGFLAGGLVWSIIGGREDIAIFFLACVIIAGVYGGISVKRSILYMQAAPAAAALVAVLLT